MNCDNFFYPLRPRNARSRPPILGGQLIETEEHKNRFLRTKYMSLCSYVKTKNANSTNGHTLQPIHAQ